MAHAARQVPALRGVLPAYWHAALCAGEWDAECSEGGVMARSWNWRIIEYPDSHKPWLLRAFEAQSHPWSTNCRKKRCTKMADCQVAYDYIAGKRGRVSDNR